MADQEAISFSEGLARMWTGTATAYTLAVVENVNVSLERNWLTYRTLDGTYRDLDAGYRCAVNVGAVWTYDNTISRWWASATAVHMEIYHSNTLAPSAGVLLWTGRIDSVQYNGQQGDVMRLQMAYHATNFSAYGSAK